MLRRVDVLDILKLFWELLFVDLLVLELFCLQSRDFVVMYFWELFCDWFIRFGMFVLERRFFLWKGFLQDMLFKFFLWNVFVFIRVVVVLVIGYMGRFLWKFGIGDRIGGDFMLEFCLGFMFKGVGDFCFLRLYGLVRELWFFLKCLIKFYFYLQVDSQIIQINGRFLEWEIVCFWSLVGYFVIKEYMLYFRYLGLLGFEVEVLDIVIELMVLRGIFRR